MKKTKKKTVKKKTTKKQAPKTKTYEVWFQGKCQERVEMETKTAIAHTKKTAMDKGVEAFLLYGKEVQHGFNYTGSKWEIRIAKQMFKAILERRKKGGAPKKFKNGAAFLSVSLSPEDLEKFNKYTINFADGNKSEMFRRMLKSWEKAIEQLYGE